MTRSTSTTASQSALAPALAPAGAQAGAGPSRRPVRRVLLMFPPTRLGKELLPRLMPPLGISHLAAVIRNDYEVRLLDANGTDFEHVVELPRGFRRHGMAYEDIRQIIEDWKPDFVGMTCLFSSVWPVIKELSAMIKAVDPTIHTAAGGCHPTFLTRRCMDEAPELDFIVKGEGEYALRDLLAAINAGGDLRLVDGLAFRDGPAGGAAGSEQIFVNEKVGYIPDLDALPYPARDLLELDLYSGGMHHGISETHRKVAVMYSSRGCAAKCIFCSSVEFWGHEYRHRSPESLLDEMQYLVDTYGIQEIQFEDDNLTQNKRRARLIFEGMIARGLHKKLVWNTPNGIALWALDVELLKLAREAGCYQLTLAIESGNQEVLDNVIHKPLQLEKARELAREIKQLGIDTNAFFIIGFPGETLDDMRDTFQFARDLDLNSACFFIAQPLPGTRLFDISVRNGYLPADFRFEDATYSRGVISTPDWTAEQVQKLANTELLKYQLRANLKNPGKLWRAFKNDPRAVTRIVGKVFTRVLESYKNRPIAFPQKALTSDSTTSV
ncbi:MAG TPA: radical SAM protein [Planctomycetota bacterium]|nr:radical SAM protein [Planctomycetota bacterium]